MTPRARGRASTHDRIAQHQSPRFVRNASGGGVAGAIKNRERRADPSDPNFPRPAEPVARKVQARKAGASPLGSEPLARAIQPNARRGSRRSGLDLGEIVHVRSLSRPADDRPHASEHRADDALTSFVSFPPRSRLQGDRRQGPGPQEGCPHLRRDLLASQALPALAVVDERLNGDGTGLIFGINDESLGFILLTVPILVFGAFYVAQKDAGIAAGGENDDSGLSL